MGKMNGWFVVLAVPATVIGTMMAMHYAAPRPAPTVTDICASFEKATKDWHAQHKQEMIDAGVGILWLCQPVDDGNPPAKPAADRHA